MPIKGDYLEKSDSFLGVFHFWKQDLQSGFIVALMALPMSLGVAAASGFPPFAGIITAVVAGIFISFISGSKLAVKGPAGGLSAIMLMATIDLGNGNSEAGYKAALAVVVISGFIQIILGISRIGIMADFFPASTIHGMLAALGISMALKQIHLAMGVNPIGSKPWELLTEIPLSLNHLNPKIVIIALVALAIMIIHSLINHKWIKAIPAPLIVILVVVPLGYINELNLAHEYILGKNTYSIDPSFVMVNIPSNIISGFTGPDFTQLDTLIFWQHVLMLTLACTIESVLSSKGIDKLDPEKRLSNQNRDLFAVGIGNVLAGIVGGLPMISESKRSVVNINSGAKTQWSSFFHGLCLVLLIVFGTAFISKIPYAALAAMLVYTGARMATPTEFSKSYKIGAEQFLVFIVTFIITMGSNFMLGIACGVAVELLVHLRFGAALNTLFKGNMKILKDKENNYEVVFNGPAVFSNYLSVKKVIDYLPENKHVVFDFSKATVVDHTFMEHLQTYEQQRLTKGGIVSIAGLDYHKHLSDHPLASKRIVKKKQLDERQQELSQFSHNNGYTFDWRMVSNVSKFGGLSLSEGSTIKFEENIINIIYKSYKIEISDILVEQGVQNAIKQDHKITVCHIRDVSAAIPDFTIQKEGFFDALFNLSGMSDIDFEEYPNFSYYYLLKGPKELEIRNFFKFELIKFFEQNKGYNVECKAGSVTIYKKQSLLSTDEIEQLLTFTKNFLKVTLKKLYINIDEDV